jgi:hypothetical protein
MVCAGASFRDRAGHGVVLSLELVSVIVLAMLHVGLLAAAASTMS